MKILLYEGLLNSCEGCGGQDRSCGGPDLIDIAEVNSAISCDALASPRLCSVACGDIRRSLNRSIAGRRMDFVDMLPCGNSIFLPNGKIDILLPEIPLLLRRALLRLCHSERAKRVELRSSDEHSESESRRKSSTALRMTAGSNSIYACGVSMPSQSRFARQLSRCGSGTLAF